ncbi:PepSY-associated TM helix domain-containing protein [Flammeovirga sp. SubArs3]|uniref:PepSY-associated TM helix domain-containing protein n=1 Tax=Flammeovirga sp. SubArs3 TaxID=2995316 RepID=UPI00248CF0BD|nr:PepSY-associated TM helix domain-containing protein [Flammeovirga sp. SubArs3]
MQFTIKNIIGKLHLWLGLASGIIVFIISITGCIYVFSEEMKSVFYKDRNQITLPTSGTERLPISQLTQIAEKAIDNKYTFQNIVIPNFEGHTVSFIFQDTDEDKFLYPNYVKFNKTVFINPYTGEVVKVENTKWEFFNVIFWVHITLFLGYNPVSHILVVGAVWIFVFSLLSGLYLWWPFKKNQRKQSFSFRWTSSTKWRRKNYDLHKILGFYFLPFALLAALTGLLWASEDFNKAVKWVANAGIEQEEKPLKEPTKGIYSLSPLDDILKQTLNEIPESKFLLIRRHPNDKVPYIVRSYVDEALNFTRIEMYYDRNSAELLGRQTFKDKNNGDKVQALNYDLHVGSIGGLPTKIIMFIMSLTMASLPISGFLIWRGRKKKSSKRKSNKKSLVTH